MDIDYKKIVQDSSEPDLLYLRSLIDEKLTKQPKGKIVISKSNG